MFSGSPQQGFGNYAYVLGVLPPGLLKMVNSSQYELTPWVCFVCIGTYKPTRALPTDHPPPPSHRSVSWCECRWKATYAKSRAARAALLQKLEKDVEEFLIPELKTLFAEYDVSPNVLLPAGSAPFCDASSWILLPRESVLLKL